MITLQELFDDLSYGELSNLTLRQERTNTLSEEFYPKLVSHINLGLGKLYERFNISTDKMYLHLYDGLTTYYLRGDRAGDILEMGNELYIEEDFDNPFTDNLIKVLKVYDALEVELSLNDNNCTTSIMAREYDILDIPVGDDLLPQRITVEYRAKYPKIVIVPTLNPVTYKLYIPDYIKEALLYYVASRIYKPMGNNSSTADADKSTSYLQLYGVACARIKADGSVTEADDTRANFDNGGWV